MCNLTSAIMRAAAALVATTIENPAGRHYFVCFAVEDAAAAIQGGPLGYEGREVLGTTLRGLLRRDRISTDGCWYPRINWTAEPDDVPQGPERQKLRVSWCNKIADELEEQELLALALALQTR